MTEPGAAAPAVPVPAAPAAPVAVASAGAAVAELAAVTGDGAGNLALAAAEPGRIASIAPSWAVYGFQFIAIGAWTAFAANYFEQMGLDKAAIGVMAAVPAAVAIVVGPIWGLAADRLGDMRPIYLLGTVLTAIAALAMAGTPTLGWLAVSVLFLSVGAAGLTQLVDARTIQRIWPRRDRFGQARVAGSITFMIGTVGTGLLVAATDIRAMFVVYALAMVAAGLAAVALLGRPRKAMRVGTVGPLAAVGLLRLPGLALFFVGSCVMWVSATGVMALFSLRVVELGGDTRLVGIGWATSALFEVPVMLLFTQLARRVGLAPLIVAGTLLFVARAALWSIAGSPLTLIAFTAFGGSGFAFAMVGTTSYVASRVPQHLQATAQALFGGTTFAFGSIVGAILAGQVANAYGLWAVYPAGAVVAAVAAVLIGLALRRGQAAPGER
jgi:MFS transporter, PPP family, 3-phenylpropionic acid transporter